ncbi:hypothetical protein MKX01_011063 [Papaver californicum]|nr:hypothetical protein MKX01_011063 [Papaver californicum]
MAKLSPMFHLFLVMLVIFASGKTIQVDAKVCTTAFDCPNEEYCKTRCKAQYNGEGFCMYWPPPVPRDCRCSYDC